MASTIDDELLALAGGGESSSSSSDGEGRDGPAATAAGKSRSTAAAAAKKKSRRAAAQLSSDEDAEGSDEDDGDGDSDEDNDDDDDIRGSGPLYPYEGSYKNYEDKARIEQLPLIERESILATRRDEVLSRERSRQLRGMVAAQQGRKGASLSSSKKRNAPRTGTQKNKTARNERDSKGGGWPEEEEEEDTPDDQQDDDDDDRAAAKGRSSGRSRKTVGQSETRNKTLQELSANRRKRAAGKVKGVRDKDRDQGGRRRGRRSSSNSEDEETDESEGYIGSDVETNKRTSGRQGKNRREEGPFVVPGVEDINRARIGREDIIKVMYRKGWEDELIGNFVRVVADARLDERTGKMVQRYRAYEVIGWKTGPKWYQVDTGKYTRLVLELRFAKERHEKQILFVSNSDITAEEFQRYELQARESPQRPSKRRVLEKADEWDDFVNEPWTEEVFTAVVKARKTAKQEAEAAGAVGGASGGASTGNGNTNGRPSAAAAAATTTTTTGVPRSHSGSSVGPAATTEIRLSPVKGEDVLLAELNERNRRSDRERIAEAERRQAENRRLAAKTASARGGAGAATGTLGTMGTGYSVAASKNSSRILEMEIDLGDF